jgi:hypothetical protein
MFVFHALEAPNGRNPFRLPMLPVVILPHATPADAALTTNARLFVALCFVGEVESVTVTETVEVPVAVAVPVIAPVELLIDSPLGNPLALKLYGGVPPVATTEPLYAIPAVAAVNVVVVIDNALAVTAEIVICRLALALLAVGVVESVTLNATVVAPAEVGVPVIAPVVLLSTNPPGSPLALYLYGFVPPAAAIALLYALPTFPFGRDVVVIETELVAPEAIVT